MMGAFSSRRLELQGFNIAVVHFSVVYLCQAPSS